MKLYFRRATAALLVMALFGVFFCLPAGAVVNLSLPLPVPSENYIFLLNMVDYMGDFFTLGRGKWTDESHAAFKEKEQYANTVLNDPFATDEDYNKAADGLQAAIEQVTYDNYYDLPINVFYDQFSGAAEINTNLIKDYTDESWKVFLNAWEYAESIDNKPSPTDEEYLDAAQRLQYAVLHLKPYSYKGALWDYLRAVMYSDISENFKKYSSSSYRAFDSAFQLAYNYAVQDKILQKDIDSAIVALYQAVEDLVLLGDVNGDETVSVADVLEVQKSLACMITLNETQTEASDVDASGTVDVADAINMQKYLAGMLGHFPAGEQNK